jgi:hypothetical protein
MLYKNKYSSELIQFVGLDHGDYKFRYIEPELSTVFFSLSKSELDKYWEEEENSP